MAHQAVGNQPLILPAPAAGNANGQFAIETEVLKMTGRSMIPVVQMRANILPGAIDNPEVLFSQGIQATYAQALRVTGRPMNPEDTVQIQIHHAGITGNGGYWGSTNEPVQTVLQTLVGQWEAAMQSGEEVDLSQGALEMILTYTLMGAGAIVDNRMDGAAGPFGGGRMRMG